MARQTVVTRVERLEAHVTTLEELPARIDALTLPISQLREEVRAEFSATRTEIRAGDEETRRVLRDEMHTEFGALREEIHSSNEETVRSLREEIRAGDEETRRVLVEQIRAGDQQVMDHARVLYEDMKATLAVMKEGQSAQKQRRRRQ